MENDYFCDVETDRDEELHIIIYINRRIKRYEFRE